MTKQKVCWITGASSGIGESLAYCLIEHGFKIILSARNYDALVTVKTNCIDSGAAEDQIEILTLDVTDSNNINSKVNEAIALFGQIDCLINNAGISQRSICLETEMSTYRRLFEVDVFGPIALTKALLPHMVERQQGQIAVTASVAGKIGVPLRTGYCAAKHSVMGFFDALRAEVAQHNITVSTIVPGFIKTDLSQNALKGDGSPFAVTDQDIANGMDANKAANIIVKGLLMQQKEIPVGEGIEMLGLYIKRFLPSVIFKMMEKRATKA